MKKITTLAMNENQHRQLKAHLFPGDGLEAAAILLCNRCGRENVRLTIEKIIRVPYSECKNRTSMRLTWPGDYLEKSIDEANYADSSIILIHSHPGNYPNFSRIDDDSDRKTMPCLQHGSNSTTTHHGSAIMLPTGLIKARLYDEKMMPTDVSRIVVVGENIRELSAPALPTVIPFTSEMTEQLSKYTACIVGLSGTGSITAELLARLGVGHLILVDFDRVEFRNLNRILYATIQDVKNQEFKTKILKRAILSHHPTCKVTTIERSIEDEEAIIAASDSDVIFSCVDSIKGRHYCDLIAQACIAPLIDMGVTIPTRKTPSGSSAIADVLGRIDYVFPGGPSLFDRGVVTSEGLRAEYLYHADNSNYQQQVIEGYIRGHVEEAPSVISLNMRTSSAAVNEWLSRLYKIRHDDNSNYAQSIVSLSDMEEEHVRTKFFKFNESSILGRGLRKPLLNLPCFMQNSQVA